MKNIVKIDLSKYSVHQLEVVCRELLIDYDLCIKNKTKADVCLAFFDVDADIMFAYTLNSDPEKIIYFAESLNNMLLSIPICDIEVTCVEKMLSDNKCKKMDDILDKINDLGMNSLLKEELEFLGIDSAKMSENIVCIELSEYTEDQILSICEEISDEMLVDTFMQYKVWGVNKIYYDIDKNWILAYTLNSEKDCIKPSKNIDPKSLESIKPTIFKL